MWWWAIWDKMIALVPKTTTATIATIVTRNLLKYRELWNDLLLLQVPISEFFETHLIMLILVALLTGVVGWLAYITFRDRQLETFPRR